MTQSPAIFYDLETSDLWPVGQILNFCLTLVDEDFQKVCQLKDRVSISRLQLPRAGAILANRVNVLEHQQSSTLSEQSAMESIFNFIKTAIQRYGDFNVRLIGYNSSKFDWDYLRTSFIRNGFNPYFKVLHKDLILLSRKLSVSRKDFPRLSVPGNGEKKLSLSLETLCKTFSLLSGPQSHESSDDVDLTIELACTYARKFGLDVRDYNPYEVSSLMGKDLHPVVLRLIPQYDLSSEETTLGVPYVLLDSNSRYALWVNLNRFAELKNGQGEIKRAIEYFKFDTHDFLSDGIQVSNSEFQLLASEALKTFEDVRLSNYFSDSDCDIEMQSTRISPVGITKLGDRFRRNGDGNLDTDDQKIIATRYKLANANGSEQGLQEKLRDYALYRYGGRMKVNKFSKAQYQEGSYSEDFHPTFTELWEEIENAEKDADNEAKRLMRTLKEFYRSSDIYKVAGEHLEKIKRARLECPAK